MQAEEHTRRHRPSAAVSYAWASIVIAVLRRFVANNWKVALYVVLIVLCVLFAPEAPLKFIYTEF